MNPSSEPTAAAPQPQGGDALPLALACLTRHHGRERSAQSLLAGMPVNSPLTPADAVRVMKEAGYRAGLIERPLAGLSPLLLPAVLLLRDGGACVLSAIAAAPDAQGERRYEVQVPGAVETVRWIGEAELAADYLGAALLATPDTRRQAATEALLLPEGRHWLWGTLRRFVPYYRSALVAALLSNVLMLAIGLITAVVFDRVIPHHAFVTLWALASGGILALGFDLAARQLRAWLIDSAGRKADLLIGSLLFRQTLAVRMEHRPQSAGSHAHHMAQVEVVRDFFASATLAAVSDLPFVLLFVAMTFVIGGPLGWVLVLAIPVIIAIAALVQGSLRRSMSSNMTRQAELQGLLVEALEGLEDLKAAGAQGSFLKRYEEATAAAAESALRARLMSGWTNNLTMAAQQLVTLVMLVWGVYLIRDGTVSGGALIGAVMLAGRAIAPLGSVVGLATRYQGARAALTALERLMQQPTEHDAGRSYVAHPRLGGQLALREAGFRYPQTGDAPAPEVLKGVDLHFRPGERVAILGRIGSGKSTILRLLAGLYQPSSGRVEVDGLDLRQLDLADFRAGVGFVSQEPRLFNGSLRENVLMGRGTVSAAQLGEVARLTGLDRLVASHPQGWELPVGEMGGLLSGGQRQLVALARCLVTGPQVLLMDEPTSSMDAQSELVFLRRLREAVGTRTLIAVTHRPAVLELVERIVVIEGGKVVIDGPKAAVLAAMSGNAPPGAARPAAASAPAPAPESASASLHLHPSAQPVAQGSAL